jgi:malto-oligosyltrehalose synthase
MQLADIGFSGAREQVAYLHELGIETLYVSPILAATPGSTHGYDVIDPDRLEPALGTRADLEALLTELDGCGMRLLLDIVPNHMAANPANRWWWEVMRDGEHGRYGAVFDIDWQCHDGRVLVPNLSRPLAEVIAGAVLTADEAGAVLEIDGQHFPLSKTTAGTGDLAEAIQLQHYRPAYWRLGRDEGNYRRFFDIDGLIGVRIEDPAVFDETHRLIVELCSDERVAGVRVDHIDGLADPASYLARLQVALGRSRTQRAVVLVEKILARDEALAPDWAVEGTTGYEFADVAGGLFVNEQGARSLFCLGAAIAGVDHSFADLSLQAKREVLAEAFRAPLERLSRLALTAIERDEPGQDLSVAKVRAALVEMTVGLRVYRTYLDDKPARRSDRIRLQLTGNSNGLDPDVTRAMGLLKKGLLHAAPASVWLEVAQRWQQLTGAVAAKGVEDTAAYRYSGLLSHAEVGSDPDHPSAGVRELENLVRSHLRHSSSLNATSTHDSKRNEDARARLYALSEAAEEWAVLVTRWHRRYSRAAGAAPDSHDELVVYETLAVLWPSDATAPSRAVRRRAEAYALKAAREAKQRTGWVDGDAKYETALITFVSKLAREPRFVREMGSFISLIGPAATTNSLALVVLKVLLPGVPDFYQGTELFEATVTDPDNRREVDYRTRRALLRALSPLEASAKVREAEARCLLSAWTDGRIKMFITRALLHFRRNNPQLFEKGTFHVLAVEGAHRDHVVALARRRENRCVVALVPRLVVGVAGGTRFPIGTRSWEDTVVVLPVSSSVDLTDVLTGSTVRSACGRVKVADALGILPVSLLSCDFC